MRPLINWVGGKTRIAAKLTVHFPKTLNGNLDCDNYYEPFVGGGGMLLHLLSTGILKNKRIVASDINVRLIEFYKTVQSHPLDFIKILESYDYAERSPAFNELKYNKDEPEIINRAATFYILMQKCFNGIYHVNSRGKFNVPIGRPSRLQKFEMTDIIRNSITSFSAGIQDVEFNNCTYEEAFLEISKMPGRTLVYADSPYEGTYGESAYSIKELFQLSVAANNSGAFIAISNFEAATEFALLEGITEYYDFDIPSSEARKKTKERMFIIPYKNDDKAEPLKLTDEEMNMLYSEL